MSRAETGNLNEAFAAAWRTIEISDQAEREITDVARASAALEAEVDDGEANWILVHAFPGDDMRTMRNLARRRFGVFRPMQASLKTLEEGGNALLEATLSGWLLVYAWDIRKHYWRIMECPGVMCILNYPNSNEPVPVPDSFVQKLRARSWDFNDSPPRSHAEAEAERHEARIKQATKPKHKPSPKQRAKMRKERQRANKIARLLAEAADGSNNEAVNALQTLLTESVARVTSAPAPMAV